MRKLHLLVGLIIAVFIIALSQVGETQDKERRDTNTWVESMVKTVVQITEKQVDQNEEVPVAVAGLRGNQKKSSSMKPYWKGDLSRRAPDYKDYNIIQVQMQKQDYRKAIQLVNRFKKEHPNSKLLPEVQFTLGLAHAAIGNQKKATLAFEEFIHQFPDHDLADSSREGIERLGNT